MHLFEQLTLPLVILLFLVAATIIDVFGVKMTHVARALSVQTGVGGAFVGAVFVGAATSLSGLTASITAARLFGRKFYLKPTKILCIH